MSRLVTMPDGRQYVNGRLVGRVPMNNTLQPRPRVSSNLGPISVRGPNLSSIQNQLRQRPVLGRGGSASRIGPSGGRGSSSRSSRSRGGTGIGSGSMSGYPQALGSALSQLTGAVGRAESQGATDLSNMQTSAARMIRNQESGIGATISANLEKMKGLYGQQYDLQKDLIGKSAQAEAESLGRTAEITGNVLAGQKGYIDEIYARERPGYEAALTAQQQEVSNIASQTAASQTQVVDDMVSQGRMDIDQATSLKTQEKERLMASIGQYGQQATNMLQKQLADSLERASAFKKGANQEIENQFLDQLGQLNVAGAKGGFSSPQNAEQTKLLTNKLKASVDVEGKVATLQEAASQSFTQAGLQVLGNVQAGEQTAGQWGMQIANEAMNSRTALGQLAGQAKVATLGNLGTSLTAASNRRHDKVSEFIAKHVSDHINYKTQMNVAEMARANLIAGLDRQIIERANDRQLTALGAVTNNIAGATERAGNQKVEAIKKFYDDYLSLIKDITQSKLELRRDATRMRVEAEKLRFQGIQDIQDRRGRA